MTPGFVVIGPNGHIRTDWFEYDAQPDSCREAGIVDMEWAILKLTEAIEAARTPPYHEQTCASDLPDGILDALVADEWLTV